MRDQLIQYVELLFAAAPNSTEIKQEILQNTLDRYDDLISQGSTPENAYQISISGIGDIREILGNPGAEYVTVESTDYDAALTVPEQQLTQVKQEKKDKASIITLLLIGLGVLFILSNLKLISLAIWAIVIVACVSIYKSEKVKKETRSEPIISEEKAEPAENEEKKESPQARIRKNTKSLASLITLGVYLMVSFQTGAWYITWIIFPISGCIRGLIGAIIDLKEGN